MAISRIELDFFGRLLSSATLKEGGAVLELGETEFADEPLVMLDRWQGTVAQADLDHLKDEIRATQQSKSDYQRRHGGARALYSYMFGTTDYTSVDIVPSPRGIWADLNRPFNLRRRFRVCVNNGTSEHVFNQANVFKMMHDHTEPGGMMIHWTPTLGWTNHGLFNAQPGFFFDLARANGYRIERLELGADDAFAVLDSPDSVAPALANETRLADALICAALRKIDDAPFVMPMQGQSASDELMTNSFGRVFAGNFTSGWNRGERTNFALGKPASQSSTSVWSWHHDPMRDAAGGNNGLVSGSFGFHTDYEDQPWWSVDLEEPKVIRQVVVYNRIDLPDVAARAGRMRIAASLDRRQWIELAAFPTPIAFGGADGNPLRLNLATPLLARHVLVGLLDRNCLHLDEVEVY